jgi:long-subunit acyl-CoA synthetase (AMP-forming)
MFSKYILDPEATAKAHDEDGYYRTGDSMIMHSTILHKS